MVTALSEHAGDVQDVVSTVVGWSDSVGVLSLTAGMEPGAVEGRTPAWAIAVENDLAKLRAGASPTVRRCLDDAVDDLAELIDPAAGGRGRATYVALGSGARRDLVLQAPLPNGARLGRVAHVLPLLEVLEEGAPSGLVLASRDLVVVHERELGHTTEVERIELEPWVGDWWPEMKGPSRANPARGQHSVSQRERYSRRIAEAYRRTLHEACDALGELAVERGWRRAVLAGDARLVDALGESLRRNGITETSSLPATLEGTRQEQAHDRLERALHALVADLSLARADAVREEAEAGARATCGLSGVLDALNQARASLLLLDPERTYPGLVEAGELLRVAAEEGGAEDLTDVLVARAIATDAAVAVVRGPAASTLATCGGIAARLRW